MKKTSDIESLYQTIEQNPNSYQEIVQTEQANESLGRWSLISAIHQMDDSKEAHAIHPKAAIKSAPVHQRVVEQIITQTVSTTKEEIELATDEEVMAIEPLATRPLPVSPILETQAIKPVQLNKALNALVVDTAHIKSASSEGISSLFERLNRS
ncbi:MAG: BcsR/BcsP family cellulose biosynthesis protein [Polynucleobacter sp.]|jgi:hypothetical protein